MVNPCQRLLMFFFTGVNLPAWTFKPLLLLQALKPPSPVNSGCLSLPSQGG